jgi:hypothetical protein
VTIVTDVLDARGSVLIRSSQESIRVKPPIVVKGGLAARAHAPLDKVLTALPNLAAALTDPTWSPGDEPRSASRLAIHAYNDEWTITLREPDYGVMLQLASPHFWEAFKLMDSVLGQDSPPWFKDVYAKRKGTRGRR